MLLKLLQDSRTIYTVILAVIIAPFMVTLKLPIPIPPPVRKVYDAVELAHQKKQPIIISFDFDPSVAGECKPMAVAMVRHAFATKTPVIGLTFLINGANLAQSILDQAAKEFNERPGGKDSIVYGRDYVWLGWKPQYVQIIIAMGHDIKGTFKTDAEGKSLDEMPIFKGVKNFDDIGLTTTIAGSAIPEDWIAYTMQYKARLAVGTTAVSATQYFPYMQADQIKGVIPGATGAAAYERLLVDNEYWPTFGDAGAMANTQSASHIVIILFIITGNIIYFIRKSQRQ